MIKVTYIGHSSVLVEWPIIITRDYEKKSVNRILL